MHLRRVHIDFETRSRVSVRDVGAVRYAQDESTKVLCLSYQVDDGETVLWTEHDDDPQELFDLIAAKDTVFTAHNALFEQSIWHFVCRLRMGWPRIAPKRWICVAAKAAAHCLPRALGKCGEALNLPQLKDEAGKKAMMKLSSPRKPTKNNKSEWHEDPELYETLYAYNIDDVKAEAAIDDYLDDLTSFERKVWLLDQKINKRGVPIDIETVELCYTMIEKLKVEYNEAIAEATDGKITAGTQVARIKPWLEEKGYPVEDTRGPTLRDLIENNDLPADVLAVVEGRQAISKTSTAKYGTMLKVVCDDDRIKDILMYHGANTGRWSGKFVQFQNVPRGMLKDMEAAAELVQLNDLELIKMLYDKPMDFFSWLLRGMIKAERGHDLIACDYSSIEARVLAWLANESKVLQIFTTKQCVYCAEATKIYQREITKKEHPEERQTGKVAVLALGYQGGVGALTVMCGTYRIDPEGLFEAVWEAAPNTFKEIAINGYKSRGRDSDLSKKAWVALEVIKLTWRSNNQNIVNYWSATEQAAITAVQTRKAVKCNKVIWHMKNGFLMCRLPSGRDLCYYAPKVLETENKWGKPTETLTFMGMDDKNRWRRQDTYGGKLVENITQAVARDLMADAMLKVEDHPNYEILFTVHDELVTQVPEGIGSEKELESLMCQIPAWAEGIPVEAEAWRGKRYKK